MPTFKYQAKDLNGRLVNGRTEAGEETEVAARLQRDNLYPMNICQVREPLRIRAFQRISIKDLFIFTRNLANLIKSGIPLAGCFDLLIKGAKKEGFRKVLIGTRRSIQEGKSLDEALSSYPQIFSSLYVGMVRAGEASGALSKVLYQLSAWFEREEKIRSSVQNALIYPAIMLLVGGGTIIFLMSFVIPKFELIFMDIGESLPLPTRILIGLCSTLKSGWWIILPVLFLSILALGQYLKSKKGRFHIDRLLPGIPFVGQILRKVSVARFSRTLQVLINSGIPLLNGLGIVRDAEGNTAFKRDIDHLCRLVRKGEGLAPSMMDTSNSLFLPLEIDMVRVGESCGDLQGSLLNVAQIYEEEIDRSLKAFLALLEPVIILSMALVVGFIVLAMLLPVFKMGTLIR